MTQPSPSSPYIPVGRWVRLSVPAFTDFVGFTYVDPQGVLSARGDAALPGGERTSVTVRLPLSDATSPKLLDEAEVIRRNLPERPDWLGDIGPQPPPGTLWGWWRDHPHLTGRFLAAHPDELQVLVHEGSKSTREPELMWVRVTGGAGDVFTGRLVNGPHRLEAVALGTEIRFLMPRGGKYPLRVTERYLQDRPDWVIEPCDRCGYGELLDPPSDLVPPGSTAPFTVRCGNCGGSLVVKRRGADTAETPGERKWWQVWK